MDVKTAIPISNNLKLHVDLSRRISEEGISYCEKLMVTNMATTKRLLEVFRPSPGQSGIGAAALVIGNVSIVHCSQVALGISDFQKKILNEVLVNFID
ncbi:MAG TPA: hypothetical protein VGK09_11890 [Rhodocyclaceae bacterium]|jgi:hypothetical protein